VPHAKLLTAGYIALAAADSVLAGRPGTTARRLRYLTKPALMPTLAAAAQAGRHGTARPAPPVAGRGRAGIGRGITAAQVLSWGGDVALLRKDDTAFLAGLGSFSGAHLAYVLTFALRGDRLSASPTPGVKAAGTMLLTAAPVMALAAGHKDRGLAAPVAAYATALAGMFAGASRLDPELSPRGRRAVQSGAALFLVSDALLGLQEFVLRRRVPALETAVMATYTAGQGLIAAGSAAL
jgi:uncharacterized membrane protein YhhN